VRTGKRTDQIKNHRSNLKNTNQKEKIKFFAGFKKAIQDKLSIRKPVKLNRKIYIPAKRFDL
jgi:hypothetical protein